jgi:hypothetical protein
MKNPMNFSRLFSVQILVAALGLFAPHVGAHSQQWQLTDLGAAPELATFFGDADAVITLPKGSESTQSSARPTIFLYELITAPKGRLKTAEDWRRFLKPYIKDDKPIVLRQDASQPGRYIFEFTSRNKLSETDLRSIYLAIQRPDRSVSLFIYDGVGSTTTQTLPVVRAFLDKLNPERLRQLQDEDIQRRKELKPTVAP